MLALTSSSVPLLDAIAAARAGTDGRARDEPVEPRVVLLEEFLARPELDELVGWVAEREPAFSNSQVAGDGTRGGRVDQGYRRSRVVALQGPVRAVFTQRLLGVLGHVRERLEVPSFPVRDVDLQVTATNDGEFFRAHADNAHSVLTARRLTFVYFFHREPAHFTGGRLRFYRPGAARTRTVGEPVLEVVPRQNLLVCFAPHWLHEIEPVRCPSRQFLDGRLTVNGWWLSS